MNWFGKAARMLLPWQARSERQALIATARAEKERSQAAAADAAIVERDIWRLAGENHWAAVWARNLRNGRETLCCAPLPGGRG